MNCRKSQKIQNFHIFEKIMAARKIKFMDALKSGLWVAAGLVILPQLAASLVAAFKNTQEKDIGKKLQAGFNIGWMAALPIVAVTGVLIAVVKSFINPQIK